MLPEWLPGQWVVAHNTVTTGGRTSDLPGGARGIQIAMLLTFTQGSPTYKYSGVAILPGKGKVTIKDGVVNIGLWPTNVLTLPAVVAKTPEGMVVNFSHTIWGNEPSEFKVYYIRVQERPQLPEWLPGQWVVAHNTITNGGRTSDFPAGAGPIQIATSLTFTQGSPTYEYSGGPVPQAKGRVTVNDGVVNIGLWPTNVLSLPAVVAKTPEGIVVNFSHTIAGSEPSEFKVYYTRAQERPQTERPE